MAISTARIGRSETESIRVKNIRFLAHLISDAPRTSGEV